MLGTLLLFGQTSPAKQIHLAVSICANAHSQMLTYAFITTRNGKVVSSQIVPEQNFMYMALGYWPSAYNQKKENVFQKNGIDSCWLVEDEDGRITGFTNTPFKNLWKIRFYEHPTIYDETGWSKGRYKPSNAQMEFLQREYGVTNLQTEYIYGDSLFKLLRDVQDPAWVEAYSNIVEKSTE